MSSATRKVYLGTSNLTDGYNNPEDVRQHKKSVRGMAHFSGSGNGQCCKDCVQNGFNEVARNRAGDAVSSITHRNRCGEYYRLMGEVGGTIPPGTEGCKYFAAK
jgi:hypothetical protein